ncbi:MAG: XisI protein [Deltaproteobacteria bacterium]|nr:XisI protein [Deltaproteobacteria bacterium]
MGVVAPTEHGSVVRKVLEEYAGLVPSQGELAAELVFDESRGHYELLYVGWEGWRRVHGTVVHVDLRGDLVWIQHDGTEAGIADELISRGVDPDRIVLGFQHPSMRALVAAR